MSVVPALTPPYAVLPACKAFAEEPAALAVHATAAAAAAEPVTDAMVTTLTPQQCQQAGALLSGSTARISAVAIARPV